MNNSADIVFSYHEATKHHLDRYARGPGGLDWATQPDPFRRYDGAPLIALERPALTGYPLYEPVFVEGRIPVEPLSTGTVSQLFYDSLALSAWKQVGEVRWSLRVNPSSGNLHPTEAYLVCGPVEGLCTTPMVCHYAPGEHLLERRLDFSTDTWQVLTAGWPPGTLLVGLTSIYWREAWKYGERAYRYCQHDIGHAIGAVSLAAAAMGWKATLLDHLSTDTLSSLLGVFDSHGAEPEHAKCLMAVYPQGSISGNPSISEDAAGTLQALVWRGVPNRLSPAHVDWPMIDATGAAAQKTGTQIQDDAVPISGPVLQIGEAPISFRKMVRQRRSCLALDGKTGITRDAFYQILRKVIPGPGQFPFNALGWRPMIHFGVFVHRVQDVDPGLYCLARDPDRLESLKAAMKKEFVWEKPPDCPDELALYRLQSGDARALSAQISCHQDIAADGCFSLGMMAEFEAPIRKYGPWFYPRLFWEAGLIGQVLYLEAEASDIRGTGIGCFFDDSMHRTLGLTGRVFQDLYHFTMGGPVEDLRLSTHPAYPEPPNKMAG